MSEQSLDIAIERQESAAFDKPPEEKDPGKGRMRSILLFGGLGFLFFTMLLLFGVAAKEKGLRIKTETELKGVKQAKEAVEHDLEETLKAKIDLETKYNEARREAEALTEELAGEREAKDELSARLKEVEEELGSAREDLANEQRSRAALTVEKVNLTLERDNLSKEIEMTKQSYEELSGQLEQLRLAKEALEARVKEMLGGKVDLEKIIVTPSSRSSSAAPENSVEGKVLVVNKEYNFVVLNRGQRDGLNIGEMFGIYRNDKMIAKVQVEKLYDSMAAATIVSSEKSQIKEGDSARSI